MSKLIWVLILLSQLSFAAAPVHPARPLKPQVVEEVDPVPVTSTKKEPVQVAQSDSAVIIAIGTSAIALIGVMFNGFMAYVMAKLNKKAGEANEIATVANEKSEKTLNVVQSVHQLVNGNMTVALSLTAQYAERIAELTQAAEDVAIAKLARQKLKLHEKAMMRSDRRRSAGER